MIDDYVLDGVTYVAQEIADAKITCPCKECVFDTDTENCVKAPQCSNIGENRIHHIIWVVKE
jgi:nitrite reductase/ring-hydroxylating ferredoxin subunit